MKHFSTALVACAGSFFITAAFAASCGPIDNVQLTFYGWPDNSPPSPDNAFDCGRGKGPDGTPIAGGTGSFSDPISFATATDNTNFAKCAIVYVPSLHKYFRNEDDCAECLSDWDGSHKFHIDLWTGSNQVSGGDALVSCENSLPGGSNTIINNAPDGLPVDTTPLYDGSNCYKTTYPVSNPPGLCSSGGGTPTGGSGPSTDTGTPTTLMTATSKPTGKTMQTTAVPAPADGSCAWPGHCKGASCQSDNECSDVLICGPDKTCT